MKKFRKCPRCDTNYGHSTFLCSKCEFVAIGNYSASTQAPEWCRYRIERGNYGYCFQTDMYYVMVRENVGTTKIESKEWIKVRGHGQPVFPVFYLWLEMIAPPKMSQEELDKYLVLA